MRTTTSHSRTGRPDYSEILPREPQSAATARRLLREALAAWQLDVLADDGALVVSELVANAVQHTRRDSIRIVIDRPAPAWVCVGVEDFSSVLPEPRESGAEDEGGRGLALVGELAKDWGTDSLPWGKRVWALLHSDDDE
ncbi:putative anti-sigma regulatory factor, serine/threonine protein kinase [Streptomyces albus]|uniref:Putative anti-sigma regulatory factor, serine/threonine protein kinase n=1 Tax=Streptomyces albus (strain ATCC 21838 / DSM 41398 / FERM P-419 / JCM 4703 / NBRC 107858) TaxID=1081613 RepID=A0A0B5EY25_STRA4|nr:putative anti-sigma regulatory factor, serine/threonine protein kinase [Streptomyces albus]AOU78455.1 putative anti-sigma regulatory factor, serine/threonine protein kinase [Streptomyces albus]AYN34201.1 ATP-binding protein [Streptomyces albus]